MKRHLRIAGHLTRTSGASQLQHVLVDLAESGRADRLTVGQAAAVGVDRQSAADLGLTGEDQLLLLTVGAQPGLGHVHQLGARFGVLDLGDIDIAGSDAGLLEGLGGRLHGGSIRALGSQ